MDFASVAISQYRASLAMLKHAIEACPDELWDAPEPPNRFWQVAYHSLFYVHLYLQDSLDDFVPWSKHRADYESLGHGSDSDTAVEVTPYSKDEILEYLTFCADEIQRRVPALDLDSASGFYWLPFNKRELQFYIIRHLSLHTGELCERLGTRAQIDVPWVGMDHG